MEEESWLYRDAGRRAPARGVHILGSQPTIVWLTACSKDRCPWLAKPPVMEALHDIWTTQATAWLVGDYLLMPDHVHLFCAPHDLRFSIEKWVGWWKECLTKRHLDDVKLWQAGGFHHRIRSRDEYSEKWTYMMENPVRKGLAKTMYEWPWRGRVHDVRW